MNGGLIKQKKDGSEFLLGAVFNLPEINKIPENFVLKPLEIKKQERQDGCVGCAIASASELQENRLQDEHFSYLAGKYVSNNPNEWGLSLKDGLKGACEHGTLDKVLIKEFKLNPKDFNYLDNYPVACRLDALHNRKKTYFEVIDSKGHDVFDDIKRTLYHFKQGVIFGLTWGYNIKDTYIKDIKDNGYGHCMLAIGFKGNYLVAQQSAGEEAGNKGLVYIHRNIINKEVPEYGGAYILIDMTREEAEKHIKEGTKYKDSFITRLFKIDIIQKLISLFNELLILSEKEEIKEIEEINIEEVKEQIKTMNQKLYDLAVKYLGTDASPKDFAPDNLACAESVSTLLNQLLGDFPIITGTYTLREKLIADKRFKQVSEPEIGCIIMSATGTSKLGRNTPIKNGHAGIIGRDGKILSNNPKNGQFLDSMTLDYWKSYLGKTGGYPIEYYSLNV
jgi:hypothetical protein